MRLSDTSSSGQKDSQRVGIISICLLQAPLPHQVEMKPLSIVHCLHYKKCFLRSNWDLLVFNSWMMSGWCRFRRLDVIPINKIIFFNLYIHINVILRIIFQSLFFRHRSNLSPIVLVKPILVNIFPCFIKIWCSGRVSFLSIMYQSRNLDGLSCLHGECSIVVVIFKCVKITRLEIWRVMGKKKC